MNNQLDNNQLDNNQINNNYNQNKSENMQINIGFNPATQQFQQVLNQSSMSQQSINKNQMSNLNQNNVISEKLKKYRKILHNDSITLLIISIISIILGIALQSDESYLLVLRSLFYFIFLIIIIANKKTIKKFVGVLAIVVSSFMILFAIFNHSLFDVMYFILAIFFIIHAIQYLKNIKGYTYEEEKKETLKIDKLKNISLILIIMCAVYPILVIPLPFIELYFVEKSISIVSFLFSSTSLVLNIILFIKKRKSATLYVCSVFSIIIILLSGNYVIYDAQRLLAHYTSYDTEEDKQDLMKEMEYILNNSVETYLGNYLNEPLPNTTDVLLISKEIYEYAIKLNNQKIREYKVNPETAELYKNIEETVSIYEKNEKQGYVCDGYTVVQRFYSEQECMDTANNIIECSVYEDYKRGETYAQTFIKCTGRYEYQTDEFNEEQLNKSKNNKEEYINLGFKELEYKFNQSVLDEFKWNLKFDDITYKIINKNEYESQVINNYENKSVFSKAKYTNYVCDGYVELNLDTATNEYVGNPYINCTGEYNYKTDGFDTAKLSNSN